MMKRRTWIEIDAIEFLIAKKHGNFKPFSGVKEAGKLIYNAQAASKIIAKCCTITGNAIFANAELWRSWIAKFHGALSSRALCHPLVVLAAIYGQKVKAAA